jgi:hypothetical protein
MQHRLLSVSWQRPSFILIEWTDFAETKQQDPRVELYRKRCDKLSPLVNRPGEMDEAAVAELRSIIEKLRSISNSGGNDE